MLIDIDPTMYQNYVIHEGIRKMKVLYVEVNKALYGMLQSSLLFYKKFKQDLESIGFKINPYDPCVANRDINGKQQTVTWHVDDLKSSHVDASVNDDFAQRLEQRYGDPKVNAVKVTRGKLHDYLGMIFDFLDRDKVKINMTEYLSKVIADFPEEIIGKVATPAGDHLFKVRDDGRKLNEEQADAFRHTVYQLLFAANRARRDIQTAVSFLATRVQAPDEDDWGKLK
jgi:hypothetical protein